MKTDRHLNRRAGRVWTEGRPLGRQNRGAPGASVSLSPSSLLERSSQAPAGTGAGAPHPQPSPEGAAPLASPSALEPARVAPGAPRVLVPS